MLLLTLGVLLTPGVVLTLSDKNYMQEKSYRMSAQGPEVLLQEHVHQLLHDPRAHQACLQV